MIGSIVKTSEQLAALPAGSVLMFADGTETSQAVQKSDTRTSEGLCWFFAGSDGWWSDAQIIEDGEEYVVIWVPAAKQDESRS